MADDSSLVMVVVTPWVSLIASMRSINSYEGAKLENVVKHQHEGWKDTGEEPKRPVEWIACKEGDTSHKHENVQQGNVPDDGQGAGEAYKDQLGQDRQQNLLVAVGQDVLVDLDVFFGLCVERIDGHV